MKSLTRRHKYQYGTLVPESRRRGPDVWVYRFTENSNEKSVRRKVIIGNMEDLPTRADAERASQYLRHAANPEARADRKIGMRGLIDRYTEEVLKPCLDVALGEEEEESALMSCHCARTYRSVVRKYISPKWEKDCVAEFERAEKRAAIEAWLKSLLRSKRNPKGLAPKSVRSIFMVMKLIFKFAVKWGYLEQNPMGEKRVELPRGSTKRLKKPVQLTAAQFLYLLPLFGLREKLAIAFAGWLGPRISEGIGLRWEDLDLENSSVKFERGVVQGRITPLKTEASRTEMSLPEEVLQLLIEWRGTTPYNGDSDWVFASPYTKGKRPFWPNQLLRDHIQPVALKAGLPKIGWHSFRHTVSAWGKAAGFSLEEVKTLLRHENVATASQNYGRVELHAKRVLQQKLVDYVRQQAAEEGWKPETPFDLTAAAVSGSVQ
jgi:integrase